MMVKLGRSRRLAVVGLAGFVACLGAGTVPVRAYDFGGFGWFMPNPTPASVTFLNDHAIARANAAAAARPQSLQAPSRVRRDVEFFNRYDAATRAAMEARVARYPRVYRNRVSETPPQAVVNDPPAPPPPPALATFFNKMRQFGWPAEAPIHGDLATKRSESEDATLAVVKELEAHGTASLSTVAEARNKLLDYGRPALQFVRDNSTAPIADGFHLFLLSLYDSIGQTSESSVR